MSVNKGYQRYIRSAKWRAKAKKILRLTRGRCVIFPWLKARDVHHLHYENFGREWFVRDCVPVSRIAHNILGCWLFWAYPQRMLVNAVVRLLAMLWAVAGLFG